VETFYFEVQPDLAGNQFQELKMPATESWHLKLKYQPLEKLFVIPVGNYEEALALAMACGSTKLATDLSQIFKYSLSSEGIDTQSRNKSPFMAHLLTIIGSIHPEKHWGLIMDILAQPDSWFDLYLNGFPQNRISRILATQMELKPENVIKAFGSKMPLHPKSKGLLLESYLEWVSGQLQPSLHYAQLEKFFVQVEKQQEQPWFPKKFLSEIVCLLVKYRIDTFEFLIRKWYMFGLVDERIAGNLDKNVQALNATFAL
jgi:hypothetical protein